MNQRLERGGSLEKNRGKRRGLGTKVSRKLWGSSHNRTRRHSSVRGREKKCSSGQKRGVVRIQMSKERRGIDKEGFHSVRCVLKHARIEKAIKRGY